MAIVLSVLLRYIYSDYPFDIFKLFLSVNTMICKYTQCLVFVSYIPLLEKCISKQDN